MSKNGKEQSPLIPSALKTGLGVAGLTAAGIVGAMPGLRREAWYAMKRLAGKVPRDPGLGQPVPEYARKTAKEILRQVRSAGVPLHEARIAVSGIGGSGKSTIARALAEQMKTQAHELDVVRNTFLKGKRLEDYIKKTPVTAGSVFEQTHLLNKVDPRNFNVAVRVTTPVSRTKEQLLKRQRGAWQYDLYNINKLDKAVQAAHSTLGGKQLRGVGNVEIRVGTGNNAFSDKALRSGLRSRGVSPDGLSREEQIQSLISGRRVAGAPGMQYLRQRRVVGLASAPIVAGTLAGLASREGGGPKGPVVRAPGK